MEAEIITYKMCETNKEELNNKLEDLQEKYISLELLNKKFLSEMAMLQQEKQSVDSKLNEITAAFEALNETVKSKDDLIFELSTKDWFYIGALITFLLQFNPCLQIHRYHIG